jgi:hypothetical protein
MGGTKPPFGHAAPAYVAVSVAFVFVFALLVVIP